MSVSGKWLILLEEEEDRESSGSAIYVTCVHVGFVVVGGGTRCHELPTTIQSI